MESREELNSRLRRELHDGLCEAERITELVKDRDFVVEARKSLSKIKSVTDTQTRIKTSNLKYLKNLIDKLSDNARTRLLNEEPQALNIMPAANIEERDARSDILRQSINREIAELAESYDSNLVSNKNELSFQNSKKSEERIALKYPRKKIITSPESEEFKITDSTRTRPKSPLFRRRDEVFPVKQCASTYAEHKRQLLASETRQIEETCILPSATHKATFEHIVNVTMRETAAETAIIPKIASDVSCERNYDVTSEQIVASKSNEYESENLTDIVESQHQKQVVTQTRSIPSKQDDSSTKKKTDSDTGGGAVQAKSKIWKKKRELHNLLSYTHEICKNQSKLKNHVENSTTKDDNYYLQQFGITRDVLVVVNRVDLNGNSTIAHRTRSKSIDSSKLLTESNERCKPQETLTSQSSDLKKNHAELTNRKKSDLLNSKSSRLVAKKSLSGTMKIQSSKAQETSINKKCDEELRRKKLNSKDTETVNDTSNSPHKASLKPKENKIKRSRRTSDTSSNTLKLKKSRTSEAENAVPMEEIPMYITDSETDGEEMHLPEPNVQLKQSSQFNIDVNVHCHSDFFTQCCLCNHHGDDMVRHYVYSHPTKTVFISRFTPAQADLIRKDPYGISGRRVISRFGDKEAISFRCYFCNWQICETVDKWIHHISTHTGEYRYKCRSCPTVALNPYDNISHHKHCYDPSIVIWNNFSFDENHLYAYMCDMCNFVQVHYLSMQNHIKLDHQSIVQEITFIRFSLVNFGIHNTNDESSIKLEPIFDDCTVPTIREIIENQVDSSCSEQTTMIIKLEPDEQLSVDNETVSTRVNQQCHDKIMFEAESVNDVIEMAISNQNVSDRATAPPLARCIPTTANQSLPRPANGFIKLRKNNNLSSSLPATVFNSISSSVLHEKRRENFHATHVPNVSDIPAVISTTSYTQSNMISMKPWISLHKRLDSIKLTQQFLLSFFKCYGFNCGFHSDDAEAMRIHLGDHHNICKLRKGNYTWLQCCYCNYEGSSIKKLLEHIESKHQFCAFQCNRCFYRSRDCNSVFIHQNYHHRENEAKNRVLCLSSQCKEFNLIDQDRIIIKMNDTVKSLNCSICSKRNIFDLKVYRSHMESHKYHFVVCHICGEMIISNSMMEHIKSHNIDLYQCVYCVFGTDKMWLVYKHVVDAHPHKMLCYHVRGARCPNPSAPFVRVQSAIIPERLLHF